MDTSLSFNGYKTSIWNGLSDSYIENYLNAKFGISISEWIQSLQIAY